MVEFSLYARLFKVEKFCLDLATLFLAHLAAVWRNSLGQELGMMIA
jgi:hypothetical protein